ncbi:MAG TPA: hypothetical protein PK536_02955 [Ignavibacteria bacterium]|nr:hypothetical protein [Ignavibacteria bacterium]HRK00660.1 hypothetical protein [Ignavibacteria bacterium]
MKKIILMVFSLMVFISSCSKTGEEKTDTGENSDPQKLSSAGVKESGTEFDVRYEFPRKIFKIEKEDVNSDGNREIFVLSVLKDTSDKFSSYYNFDMVEVFSLDRAKEKYVKILTDTVDYSTEINFKNLSNSKDKLIFIKTNTGGNDPVNSEGMFVYQMKDSANIELMKYFEAGSPEVSDFGNQGNNVIVVKDQFLGVMPQVNAVSFVKEIYTLQDNKLVISNEKYPEVYDKKINEITEEYNSLKRKVETGMQALDMSYPLYREAAEIFVNYYYKGDTQGLRKFWEQEKESLKRNIPQDEFQDLNNFISKALPTVKNA